MQFAVTVGFLHTKHDVTPERTMQDITEDLSRRYECMVLIL